MKIKQWNSGWIITNDYGEDLILAEDEIEELCDLLLKKRADLREKQQREVVEWILQDPFDYAMSKKAKEVGEHTNED